jgi:SH3-like domain-containing protein
MNLVFKSVFAAFVLAVVSPFNAAYAADFRSTGDKPAIWYDGPSQRSNKQFIVPRNSPLEIVVSLDQWTKVRDETGDVGWLENKSFGSKRFVKTIVDADVKASAADAAATVFAVTRSVSLEIDPLQQKTAGWVRVIHRDGQSGWLPSAKVWGQ